MRMPCNCPFTHFEVNNPNGDVTFCSVHNMVLGNVNKNSIEEIWNGEAYRRVRRDFLDGRIFKVCSPRCPVLKGWKDFEKIDWYDELPDDSNAYKNAVLNEEEMAGGKVELMSRPRWLRFAASYACNLKCYHCSQRPDRSAGLRLPDSFFEDLKRHLDAAQMVFFYGGEPLIEKSNLDLMEYMSRERFPARVFFISNGTVLNEKIKTILEKLNFGYLDVSIDSVDESLYEELRYPAKFADTMEHLRFLSALIKKKGGRLFFSMTINKKNQNELIRYIKFSMDLGAAPFFQFAHNTFKEKKFREKYEIFSIKEHRDVRRHLLEARTFLRAIDLPLTSKNIDYLLTYSYHCTSIRKKMEVFVSKNLPVVKRMLKKIQVSGADERGF